MQTQAKEGEQKIKLKVFLPIPVKTFANKMWTTALEVEQKEKNTMLKTTYILEVFFVYIGGIWAIIFSCRKVCYN